jgi:PhnB protein
MARVNTYLNFMGNTEEAFEFYRSVFGTEYEGEIFRIGDVSAGPGEPELTEEEKQLVMHMALPILAGHVLEGTDMVASMGHELRIGNNTTIALQPDTREEADTLFAALSQGATDVQPMSEQFWGDYWGTCLDRFGVRWMFDVPGGALTPS